MSPNGDDSSVKVAIRIRPQLAREQIEGSRICTFVTTGEPQITLGKEKQFTYDYVFDIDNSQADVYGGVENLVEGCFDGFNATIIAYGQTGSGKTHTMGTGFEVHTDSNHEGMIPRALRQIFKGIECRRQQAEENETIKPDFFISVQFMEIYNEKVLDLFDSEENKKIRIHEKDGAIVADGLRSCDTKSFESTMKLLQQGALNRTTASTKMNTASSRSHAVFTLNIRQTRPIVGQNGAADNVKMDLETVSAKFHFVDLAGSERLKRTGATGDRAKEGISINQGLLALGNVISALGDNAQKRSHVPYRDSKITRLLQDSLGGNSRTIMIACISPSDSDFMETLNTLKYANRARNIQNKITQNQDSSSKQLALLRTQLSQALSELALYKTKSVLTGSGDNTASSTDVAAYNDMFQENYMLQEEIKKLKEKIKEVQDIVDHQKSRLVAMQMENVDSKDEVGRKVVEDYLAQIEDLKNRLTQAEMRNARPRIGSARETSTLNTQNPKELIERAKYEIELRKSGVLATSDEISPRDSHDDEDDHDYDAQSDNSPSDDEDVIEYDINVEEQNNELIDMNHEIDIKEQLVIQLETTMANLEHQRKKYENQLTMLEMKIKEAEKERDLALAKQKAKTDKDPRSKEKIKDMESKLGRLRDDLKHLQTQRIENEKLSRREEAKSRELVEAKNKLQDMKRQKLDLIKKMRDEAKLYRENEKKTQKEINKLKKSVKLKETNMAKSDIKHKTTEGKLQRSEQTVQDLKLQLKHAKSNKNGIVRSPRPPNGLRQHEGNIRPQTRSRVTFTKSWSHLQHKLRSAIAAKEATKDVENELEKLLSERKRLEDDKGSQNDDHIEYISERIQEAQSQLVELTDDEPLFEAENVSRNELAYLLNQMVPFFVNGQANVNTEKRLMTGNYHKVKTELESQERNYAVQREIISHLMDKKSIKENTLSKSQPTSTRKKRALVPLTAAAALGPALDDTISDPDERSPSPASTVSSGADGATTRANSTSKLSRFGGMFQRLSTNKVVVDRAATGKFLPSHSTQNQDVSGLKCTRALVGHKKAVNTIVGSDEYLFTSGKDKTIKMWDLVDEKELIEYQMPNSIEVASFDPSERTLYTVDGSKISAWDTKSGSDKPLKVISESKSVSFIDVDDFGRLWVAADKVVKCYKTLTDSKLRCITQSEITALSIQNRSDTEVHVAVGGRDHSIRLFRHSFELPPDQISPKFTFLSPHLDTVTALVQIDDFVISGSRDAAIKLWNMKGELLKTVAMAHADWILSIKPLPGRSSCVSVARDGSLAVWSTNGLEKISYIMAGDAVSIGSIATSQTHIYTGSPSNKAVKSWLICF